MQKIFNKGHRIRASDKHLVYHFSIGTLLFVFVAVLLLLNMKQPSSYVKAEDIVLKNKDNQNAGSPQNPTPQGQPKK